MSFSEPDYGRLDDPEALAEADPGEMLRHVASAAAQVREAQLLATEAGVERIAVGGRPRAVVVAGMGGSGIAGGVLAAVCGLGCPVPITTVHGYRLPGWVGAADLVIAISRSGATEETLGVAADAARRGCRLLCVGANGSPLAEIAVQSGAVFVPVAPAAQTRAALWGLAVPPLLAAGALGLAQVPPPVLERTAERLEEMSHLCRPASESFVNPGKQTAVDLAGSIPLIWGTSPLTGVVADRFAAQLAINAKYPAIAGELPEAGHDQVLTLDGPFAVSGAGEDDFFRDRVDEPEATRLRLVVIRDTEEHPQVTRRREASIEIADERGVPVTQLSAQGEHPLERLAGLIAHVDYASVYLALALGADPTPVPAIQELKVRIT
ncbi:SIS domain-containing protein [Actinomadura sp. DC4]|uniref:SIS domain-containing protein n=1 Tax=Actinomadura sp. DC4 TaxID=3055069 RepID=UPI0025AFEF57|nr:SIS domain-containing protein [Actinomadura sp. DC4]MDN3355529.1 SIS domain-containing protein [Actinomadura sp. DC4]